MPRSDPANLFFGPRFLGRWQGALRYARAFVRMGYLSTISYPLNFALSQATAITPVFVYYFLRSIVRASSPSVGGDYFTWVTLGIVTYLTVGGGLQGLSIELDQAIQQGRLELLLIEPTRWRLVPVGLSLWPIVLACTTAFLGIFVTLAMGAHYLLAGIPMAFAVVALGIGAGLGVGMLSSSVRILSKKADPIYTLYALATALLAGIYVPLNVLPRVLRTLSWLLPSTYVASGLRKALMPHGGLGFGPSAIQAVGALLVFDAILLPLALFTFGRALDYGRKAGVLGGY